MEERLSPAAGLEERVVTLDKIQKAKSWAEIFGNDRPVVWEIGFGNGWVLKSRADREKEKNFLGIELSYQALGDFDEGQLPENARIVVVDVRQLVDVLPESLRSIDGILIDFPAPKGLVAPPSYFFEPEGFLPALLRLLRPGGEFRVRTDSSEVRARAEQVIRQVGDSNLLAIQETPGPGEPSTPFVRSAQALGRSTTHIRYTAPAIGTSATPPAIADPAGQSAADALGGQDRDLDDVGQKALQYRLEARQRRREWARRKWLQSHEKDGAKPPSKKQPLFPSGLDPARWPERIRAHREELEQQGLVRIPIPGGEAILLLRRNSRGLQYQLMDLFLKPRGRPAAYLGRVDLEIRRLQRAALAEGAGPGLAFTIAAQEFLQKELAAGSSPWEEARTGSARGQALYVEEPSLRQLDLSAGQVKSALAFAAGHLASSLGLKQMRVQRSFDNKTLEETALSSGLSITADFSVLTPLAEFQHLLAARLLASAGSAGNLTGGLEEPVDLRSYEIVGAGDQSIVYRRRDEGSTVRVFKDSQVRDQHVRDYLQKVSSLPATSVYPPGPFEIRIPQMEWVKGLGRAAGRDLGIRSDFIGGMTLRDFARDFVSPGEPWWLRFVRSSRDPQRAILEGLKEAVAEHLDEVDRRTGGLADRHVQVVARDMEIAIEFDLENTLRNFILPEEFIRRVNSSKGKPRGVRFREEALGHIHVVHVDPLDIRDLVYPAGLEEPELFSRRLADGRMYVGDGRWVVPYLEHDEFTAVLLEALRRDGELQPPMDVLDLGAGEGVVAVGIAGRVQRVDATELDRGAVSWALENVRLNDLKNVEVIEGDFFAPKVRSRRYDRLLANPPAVPFPADQWMGLRRAERLALDGGPDGRQVLDRMLREGPALLKEGGSLILVHPHWLDLEKTGRLVAELDLKMEILLDRDFPIAVPEGYTNLLEEWREEIEGAHRIPFIRKDGKEYFRLYVLRVSRPAAGLEEPEVLSGLPEELKKFWKDFFRLYQETNRGDVFPPGHSSTLLMLGAMDRIKPLFDDAEVLDTGAGSGILGLASLAAPGFRARRMTATEPDPEILEEVRANAKALGVANRLELAAGSLLSPAQGRRFDLALHNADGFEQAVEYLRGLGEVVSKDGVALLLWESVSEDYFRKVTKDHGLFLEPLFRSPDGPWQVYAITRNPTRMGEVLSLARAGRSSSSSVVGKDFSPAAGLEELLQNLEPLPAVEKETLEWLDPAADQALRGEV